nr:MAG TPA: hypothetical protein [Bacteriophage sp.]
MGLYTIICPIGVRNLTKAAFRTRQTSGFFVSKFCRSFSLSLKRFGNSMSRGWRIQHPSGE